MKRLLLLPIIVITLLLLLAGCGTSVPATSGTTPTAPTASPATGSAACEGLAKINTALSSLSKAGDNITVGEVKRLNAQISLALTVVDKLVPSDSNLSPTLDQLQESNDQIGKAVEGLPDGNALAQHSSSLTIFREHVARAQDAATQLATKLNCKA